MRRFEGKNVFVTGTGRGLGKVLVEEFASEGANIYAHTRVESENYGSYYKMISKKYGIRITPVVFDVTDYSSMKK
mgnify:CR=1 FL=1